MGGPDSEGPLFVSSDHLVSDKVVELSEYEYGLIVAANAMQRWIQRCMAAAGYPEFTAMEVQVIHSVNHRQRAKRLTDLCTSLNIEDTHTVNYAAKKLIKAGMIKTDKKGKEVFYSTTEKGKEACQRYRVVRDACLVDAFDALGGIDREELGSLSRNLRALSGLYDQAARSATIL